MVTDGLALDNSDGNETFFINLSTLFFFVLKKVKLPNLLDLLGVKTVRVYKSIIFNINIIKTVLALQ